jgi:maltose alpha-D-glucosyltransferase/alpha-amylase
MILRGRTTQVLGSGLHKEQALTTFELDEHQVTVLRDWLTQQRWYGDKSRSLEGVALDPLLVLELGSGPIDVMLIECEFTDTGRTTYFVPVQWREPDTSDASPGIEDGFSDPHFLAWLYSGFAEARTRDALGGRQLRWVAGAGSGPMSSSRPEGRVLRGEQSNTSVRFGDEAILKVFRKIQPGVNPEPEVLRFLSAHTDYRHAPADFGIIELHQVASDEPIVIGAMQGFVANSGDAWAWLLGELRSLGQGSGHQLLAQIALLGQRTGNLHLALATDSDDPAFSLECIDSKYRKRLRRRIAAELHRTLEAVGARELRSKEQIADLEDRLTAKLSRDDVLEGLALSRVHGDFHLGQVLKTDDDFVIIDFEGEPSRPFRERREKASPLKDVAGMLRSLDYAIASVLSKDVDPDAREGLVRFGRQAEEAYIQAYLEAVSMDSRALTPAHADRFTPALSIFLIEKALYEVRYELDNRPSWVEIPLGALETIALI